MTLRGRIRLGLFVLWVTVLGAMAYVSTTMIKPATGVVLQSQWRGYDIQALSDFGLKLGTSEVANLYKFTLLYADSVFVLLFGLWILVSIRRFWIGAALAVLYAVADLGENFQLASKFWWIWSHNQVSGWVLYPPVDAPPQALVAYFTQAKLLLFVVIVVAILGRDLIRKVNA